MKKKSKALFYIRKLVSFSVYRKLVKYWLAIKWAIVILVLWCSSGFVMNFTFDDRGTAGDMFGAVNALFSGLAFASLVYTLTVQRKELKLQRRELALQRDEIKRSTEELAGQKDLMYLQRFDATFFNLVAAHKEILSNVQWGKFNGKTAIDQAVRIFKANEIEEDMKFLIERSTDFELCFYNFMFVLEFIKDESFRDYRKQKYATIFLAQLTPSQVTLMHNYLFYYLRVVDNQRYLNFKQTYLYFNVHESIKKQIPFLTE